jgi:hypothetical protein
VRVPADFSAPALAGVELYALIEQAIALDAALWLLTQ